MAEPCGCKIPASATGEGNYIIYCPKHAEVDNLLAALEARMTKDGGHLKMSYDHRECEAVAAVIAAARGGAA